MARAGVCVAVLLSACGLVSKDYDIEEPFPAGGAPSFSGSLSSSKLTGPLSADVSRISSITLKAARIEAIDNLGDISFVHEATISVHATSPLPDAILAQLTAPAPAGATKVDLQVTGKELKGYLQANGSINATINYVPTPTTARELKLVLTVHGSLL